MVCGRKILMACQEGKCSDMGVSGNLWDEEKGFSIARWELWKRRFGELSGHLDATEETRMSWSSCY